MKKYFLIVITLLGSKTLYAGESSHCFKDENVIFSCATAKKSASLCASKDAAKDKGYVQYRFGVIGKPEMTFPDNKEPANKNFSFEHILGASGYGNFITFNKGTYRYEVSSSFSKGQDSGVIEVWKSDKNIALIQCKSIVKPVEDDLGKLGMNEVKNE